MPTRTKPRAVPFVQFGAATDTIAAARAAILEILTANADEKTKRFALQAFNKVCAVEHVSVSNCTFIGGDA